jgi:hypothetical protein
MTLRSEKVIFSLSEKFWTKKYPSSKFNHLSTTSASISPSNNGISKFTCTSKGVAWLLDEDYFLVGSRQSICMKFSIISFLFHVRDSSINILMGSLAPLYLFSTPWVVFRFGMADITMALLVRVPTSCTQILSRVCKKKNK